MNQPDQQSRLTREVVKCPPLEVCKECSLTKGFLAGWKVGFRFLHHYNTNLSRSPWAEILAIPFIHRVMLGNLLALSVLQFSHL